MALGMDEKFLRTSTFLLAGILTIVGAGCQTQAAGAPPPTAHQVHFTGTFENGCSPVDASGILFDLTTPEMEGWLQITIWDGLPLESGFRLPLASNGGTVDAAYCRATNDCIVARDGELVFTQVEEGSIQGRFWLDLSQEGVIQGTFVAHWIDVGPVACG